MNRRGFLQLAGGMALAQFLPVSAKEAVTKSGGFRFYDLHARLKKYFPAVTSSQAYRVSSDGVVCLYAHIGGKVRWFWTYLDALTYPLEQPDPVKADFLTVSPDSTHLAWRVSGGRGKSNVFRVYQPQFNKQRVIDFGVADTVKVGGLTNEGALVLQIGEKTAIAQLDRHDNYVKDYKRFEQCRVADVSPSGTLCGWKGREPFVAELSDQGPRALPRIYRKGTSYALAVSPKGQYIVGGWLKPGARETLPLAWKFSGSRWRSVPVSTSGFPFGFLNSVDDQGQAVGAGFRTGVDGVEIYARGLVDTKLDEINPRLAAKADLSEKNPTLRDLQDFSGFDYPWRCAVDSYHTHDSGNDMNDIGYVCGWAAKDGVVGATHPRAVAYKRLTT